MGLFPVAEALREAGEDTDYYKKPVFLTPVKEGPFYALKVGPALLTVTGGLKTDINFESSTLTASRSRVCMRSAIAWAILPLSITRLTLRATATAVASRTAICSAKTWLNSVKRTPKPFPEGEPTWALLF